jgi:16S rRNA (adenine1518-N6/adenine1519-N6)-dimethyltransferase
MKRRKLGQHYLVDGQVISEIIESARIAPTERVLEIGTGQGALTRMLVGLGASFSGYEIDRENYEKTLEAVSGKGAKVVLGDAFAHDPEFEVLVASLPYSESAPFVRWLCGRKFERAVVVLQKDFVEKLNAAPGERDYRGISAISQIAFEVKVLGKVSRRSFNPQPRVDSVIVSFRPKRRVPPEEAANVIRLFSLRRRQVDAALVELGFRQERRYGLRRVFSLAPDEVHAICGPSRPQ